MYEELEGDRQAISEAVKDHYGYHCIVTGRGGPDAREEIEAAHLKHAGLGGDPSQHTFDNVIPVHEDVHKMMHGSGKDHIMLKGHRVSFSHRDIEYTPDEKLVIHALVGGEKQDIPEDWLWFYKRPTPAKAEKAWEHHQMVLEGKKDTVMGIIKMGAGLTPIKQEEEWRDMGYSSWKNYCHSPEVSIGQRTAHRAVKIYDHLVEGLNIEPDRLSGIDQIKLEEITKVADEDNKEQWLAEAQELSREDIRRRVREVKGESLNVSCSNCANTVPFEFDQNFEQVAFGSRVFSYCPFKPTSDQGYLVETFDPQEQREIAEDCDMYEEN